MVAELESSTHQMPHVWAVAHSARAPYVTNLGYGSVLRGNAQSADVNVAQLFQLQCQSKSERTFWTELFQ